jgi:HEPN domain-containing protein
LKNLPEFQISERKADLILRLFVETADEDYLTARSCFHIGAFRNFLWSSSQAVEKYLKAYLLFKGKSVVNFRHGLSVLFIAAKDANFTAAFDIDIIVPDTTAMRPEVWNGRSLESYVAFLEKFGSPDSRYGYEDVMIVAGLLHALDQTVCLLRATMRQEQSILNVDLYEFLNNQDDGSRQMKAEEVQDWTIGPQLLLERLHAGEHHVGDTVDSANAFKKMNFAFYSPSQTDPGTFGGVVIRGSPLYNHLVRLDDNSISEHCARTTKELRTWCMQNIKLSSQQKRRFDL